MKKFFTLYKKIGKFVAFALVALALIFLALASVSYKIIGDKSVVYNGIQVMFGIKEKDTAISNFNPALFIGMLLAIIGVVLMFIKCKAFPLSIISALCFVTGAIIVFMLPSTISYVNEITSALYSKNASLGIGAILSGISLILATLVATGSFAITLLKK